LATFRSFNEREASREAKSTRVAKFVTVSRNCAIAPQSISITDGLWRPFGGMDRSNVVVPQIVEHASAASDDGISSAAIGLSYLQ
jgi:hypothetical protein